MMEAPKKLCDWKSCLVKNKHTLKVLGQIYNDTGFEIQELEFLKGTVFKISYVAKIDKGLTGELNGNYCYFSVSQTKSEFLKNFEFTVNDAG